MQLRAASAADAEAITDVHLASMREAYRDLFPAGALDRIDARDRADRWRDHLAKGSSVTLLAEADGCIPGSQTSECARMKTCRRGRSES